MKRYTSSVLNQEEPSLSLAHGSFRHIWSPEDGVEVSLLLFYAQFSGWVKYAPHKEAEVLLACVHSSFFSNLSRLNGLIPLLLTDSSYSFEI